MYSALVACRTGMGSSMMLKIKVEQVIRENGWNITVDHNEVSAVQYFNGDLLITMEDLADEITNKQFAVIGIKDLMNKDEIKEKLQKFLDSKQ
ncbi:PTS sugar transporter subunit IIB [Helcococcus kunzii]|uniref:PTS sugar transporter subunit IIB n=1 Tax=Helcococcus kunzii TaxID=40091 RepID=UPI0021A33450|nr:PTS sugar transporter subunit IIB [Helcococcus kunzii]MCT1796867.1 PTS sugar transporter subunit IIB [Helcococcus kunzii]MCT1989701.1 PTS sugar transporter subunit IIB [Helcococcus kunzii]